MGLAGSRKRTKISHDPNNTNWSRSTTGFGHKILTSQGWSPGQFLGARNAAHADSFTSASASHIRVALKDDNLGLGARPGGKAEGEPTGLDAFQGLLGRLNGKSDTELEKDQRKRDDIKLAIYAGNRWKTVNFVRAGLLEQEKLRAIDEAEQPSDEKAAEDNSEEKSEKKRRKKEKTKDRSTRDKKKSSSAPGSDVETSDAKSRRRKSKSRRSTSEIDSTAPSDDQDSSKKRKSKSESKSKSKSKKRKLREGSADKQPSPDSSPSETPEPSEDSTPADSGNVSSVQSEEVVAAKSREQRPVGRRFIRGRNIMQKKMALMDDKSLNEIFMVKS